MPARKSLKPKSTNRRPLDWRRLGTGLAFAVAVALAARLEKPASTAAPDDGEDRPFGQPKPTDDPQAVQLMRAKESGRGRQAISPLQIPLAGWKDIGWRVYAEIQNDRLLAVAAGVVFYGLLALFPAITALVSSYALFADAAAIGRHLAFAAALMPQGAFGIVEEQIARIAQGGGGQLSFAFLLALGLAFWSANAGMKAMIDALNVIYGETEKRGFIALNLLSLALTLGGLVLLLLAINTVIVLPLVFAWLGIEGFGNWLIAMLRWPAIVIVIALSLGVLYRFGPSRKNAQWRWLSVGAIVATLLWVVGSAAFSLYLSNFADYNATYGSLGAGIGLMMWLWLTSIAILVGAEVNAEIEHQTACDSTTGRTKPLGARGAVMADTVGEAQ
ncbi:MAG: YihY/virulence factor BrkB family protein [Pseudorhodoplanes sp.]